jgi:hypothetical protein
MSQYTVEVSVEFKNNNSKKNFLEECEFQAFEESNTACIYHVFSHGDEIRILALAKEHGCLAVSKPLNDNE